MKDLPNLYPLRLILSIVVVIYHLPMISNGLEIPNYSNSPLFHKGELAVYYFFSLSGFLILRIINDELNKTGKFNFKRFYLRRVTRLYPVYYLILIIGIALYHVILPILGIPFEIDYKLQDLIISYIFIVPNVFKFYHPEVGSILIVLWSIGIEEQFYLFIPMWMFATRKNILLSLSILLIVLLIILKVFPDFYIYSNFYFYFICAGILSILAANRPLAFFKSRFLHFFIYTLFVLSFITNIFAFKNLFVFHLFNLSVSSILVSIIADYPIFEIKNKMIDYLGKISYGIYMYHMVIITGILFIVSKTKIYTGINTAIFVIGLNIIVLFFSLLCAHLSYKYFESAFYLKRADNK